MSAAVPRSRTRRGNSKRANKPAAAQQQRLRVELQRRVQMWSPPRKELCLWASAALGRQASGCEIGVRVVGPKESRRLNARFRGRDKPTNVLSFPAAALPWPAGSPPSPRDLRPLGDLVICPRVLKMEARTQRKGLKAHWAHLIVHGALHLIGYDHELPVEAQRMERREIRVLRRLGFRNPYRSA
jgi:probable rRNA maturation factor